MHNPPTDQDPGLSPTLAARLATLAHEHRSPGVRLAERRAAARTCTVPGCGRPGALMARGVRCPGHRPPAPKSTYCGGPPRCYCPTSPTCTRPDPYR